MHVIKLLKLLFGLGSKQQILISPVESLLDKDCDIFKYTPPASFAVSSHAIEVKEISFKEFSKLSKVEK